MTYQFTQRTLLQLRQAVGRLLYPSVDKFQVATLSAGTTTVLTASVFSLVPDNAYVGRVVVPTSGATAGVPRYVTASSQSAGTITVNPAFGSSVGAVQVEVWSDYRLPDSIKDALNLGIQRASDIVNIYVESAIDGVSYLLDSTRQIITLPTTLVKLVGVRYITTTPAWPGPLEFSPTLDWFDPLAGPQFMLRGNKIYLNDTIPSDVANASIFVRGYRLPALLSADTDLCEVRPDYLTFYAAAILDMGELASQILDPEASGQRASGWMQQATQIEARMATNWLPDTIPVDT